MDPLKDLLDEEIVGITSVIWRSVLNLGLQSEPSDECQQPSAGLAFIGSVQIRGAWEGSVLLHADGVLVRRAASIMFGMEEPAVGSDEMVDALGELTNMVGGNLKALLPAPCKLSLPTVAQGIEPKLTILGNQVVRHVDFSTEGHRFAVSLLKRIRA